MRKIFFTFLLCLIGTFGFSQHADSTSEEHHTEHSEELLNHAIGVTIGYTFVPAGGFEEDPEKIGILVPTVGLEYFYSFNHRWALGFMWEVELDNYIITRKEIKRHQAMVFGVTGAYHLGYNWHFLAGAGIEIEKHLNLAVLRVGAERPFHLKRNLSIAPSFFWDFKEQFDTWNFSIAFSKRF